MSISVERRSIRSVAITARFHSRFWLVWIAGSLITLLVLHAELYIVLTQPGRDPAGADAGTREVVILGLLIPQFIAMFACGIGIYLKSLHTVSGPFVELKRTLDRITAGEKNVQLRFRKSDRLDDIAESFNRAMAHSGKG